MLSPTLLTQHSQAHNSNCGSCALHNVANLKRLGVDPRSWDYIAAIVGNPNTGKSTLFNTLTGLRQHVGNWPGKTVARAEGAFHYHGNAYKLIDLPGTYSLRSTSTDEDISRDFLLFGSPDVTIVVVDATRLEGNLNLVLQILQVTDRVVVALNLMDEASRHGLTIDTRHLARELGVLVTPMAARKGDGIGELLESVERTAQAKVATRRNRLKQPHAQVEHAVDTLAKRLEREFPGLSNSRWIALALLEGDPNMERAVADGTLRRLSHASAHRAASAKLKGDQVQ